MMLSRHLAVGIWLWMSPETGNTSLGLNILREGISEQRHWRRHPGRGGEKVVVKTWGQCLEVLCHLVVRWRRQVR